MPIVFIEHGSATPYPEWSAPDDLKKLSDEIESLENSIASKMMFLLRDTKCGRDRARCDQIFGIFTHGLLLPSIRESIAFRPAEFAFGRLIPNVLALESELGMEFHKGALFFDTALAFFSCGDQQTCQYLLAMTDEEDHKTCALEGTVHPRGTTNLGRGNLSEQVLRPYVQFGVRALNGELTSCPVNSNRVIGKAASVEDFETWRQSIPGVLQFELIRILQDLEVFCGPRMPNYPAVQDNPYVLLRLGRALSHMSQWVESYLTELQKPTSTGRTLSDKLRLDPRLKHLCVAAGSPEAFAGNNPKNDGDLDLAIETLLKDLESETRFDQIAWRVLRLVYLVRNATTHRIEPAQRINCDRGTCLRLIELGLLSTQILHRLH